MEWVWLIIIGFVAGAVAKLLMPGRDPGGFIITILLGIAGSLLGGFGAQMLGITGGAMMSFAVAVIGAMLLLGVYRLVAGRTA